LGTGNAAFFEDNTITNDGSSLLDTAVDSTNGARWVFRYNTVSSTNQARALLEHGFGSWDGTRSFEIYNNHFKDGIPTDVLITLRGGSGLVFGNTFDGVWSTEILLVEYRLFLDVNQGNALYGLPGHCDYVNPQDPSTWETTPAFAGALGVKDRPCSEQVHDLFVWNNTLVNNPSRAAVSVENDGATINNPNLAKYIQLDRDYFLRAPTAADGFQYAPYPYPHPLVQLAP
jgi:hypothetical protein